MNHLNKIRENDLIKRLSTRLSLLTLSRQITLMEVCGTHTMAIHRAGLPSLFPLNLNVISGPGCPVCVTPASYIDRALAMAREHDVVIATFGDMMRVPGNTGTLAELRGRGYPVEIVYSPLGAVEFARNNPERPVVFLAVGFETTAPAVAATVQNVRAQQITNFCILSAHKLIIPALKALLYDPETAIDGFILPGHVSVVIGSEPYRFIADAYDRACVIIGFETADVIQGILMLTDQVERQKYSVEIQYKRAVKPGGNAQAKKFMEEVFIPTDTKWRGFGTIPESGLALRENYADFDAEIRFPVAVTEQPEPTGCLCSEVLRGHVKPTDCQLFSTVCTPHNPVGPCMVSNEGTCAAFHKYSRKRGAHNDGSENSLSR